MVSTVRKCPMLNFVVVLKPKQWLWNVLFLNQNPSPEKTPGKP
jgi:hypothetical protein